MTATWLQVATVVCTVSVCGCVATEPDPFDEELASAKEAASGKEATSMEGINNPLHESDRVSFSVITNGCTNSSDFVIEHAANNNQCELTVVRTKADFCRKASSLTDAELMWNLPPACSGLDVVFLNPQIGDLYAGQNKAIPSD